MPRRQCGAGVQGCFGTSDRSTWQSLEVLQDEQLPPRVRCTRGNGPGPRGLQKPNDERSTCRPAFRTNERRRVGARAVAGRKVNLRHGSGAKCHAPAASRQESAADRKRRCMVRLDMAASCGELTVRLSTKCVCIAWGRTLRDEARRVKPLASSRCMT